LGTSWHGTTWLGYELTGTRVNTRHAVGLVWHAFDSNGGMQVALSAMRS